MSGTPVLHMTVILAVMISGCGRSTGIEVGEVSGQITLDGQPVPHVNIVFAPEGSAGSPSIGGTDATGNYRLMFSQKQSGAMLGRHRVTIEPSNPVLDEDGQPISASRPVQIPGVYRQPGTLSAEVKPGRNEISFSLESRSAGAKLRR